MKIIIAIATTMLLFASAKAESPVPFMAAWSQEYVFESNPSPTEFKGWTDTGLRFCVMTEQFQGEAVDMPEVFDKKKKNSEFGMDLTNSKTRLRGLPKTLMSRPCWERKHIKNRKHNCGGSHMDESANGVYRVHMCG